jgi:gluconate 2-dehydrogenase gamma chain
MKNRNSRKAQEQKVKASGLDAAQPDVIRDTASITRREMIAGVTLSGATLVGASFIPVSAIQAAPQAAQATAVKPAAAFLPEQRRILEAFIDRIIPRDENGPGAVESGAAEYIDRSFVEFLAAEKESFTAGLAAVDAFARTSQGAPFAELSPEKRDAVLTAIDSGQAPRVEGRFTTPDLRAFFNRARRLTLEGMFCDPYWGGNKNFAGWDLIRYPGVRLSVTAEDQKMSKPVAAVHKSAYGANGEGENHGH